MKSRHATPRPADRHKRNEKGTKNADKSLNNGK